MARWVTLCLAIASSIAGGVGCSIVAVAAPKRSGNSRVAPRPKVKAIGARGHDDVAGLHREMRFGEGVARAEDVAVEVDAALGDAGGAAGEGDQRGVVLRGVDGRQRFERGGAGLEFAVAIVAVIFDEVLDEMGLLDRLAEVADEAAVDDRVADFGAVDHGGDLARAEQRHGRDDHPAGLEHAEPRREQGVAVGAAQQDAVAGDEAVLVDQQPRDAAGERVELGVGPAAVVVDHRQRVGRAALEQFGGGVEALGIIEQVEARELVGRGQAVADEGVAVIRAPPRSPRSRPAPGVRPGATLRPAPSPDNAGR